MTKAAKALSGIRIEDDIHEAALVAALTALEDICEPKGREYRHLRGRRSVGVPGNPGLGLDGWEGKGPPVLSMNSNRCPRGSRTADDSIETTPPPLAAGPSNSSASRSP